MEEPRSKALGPPAAQGNLVAFQLWFLPAQQILEAQIYENKIQKGEYLQEPFAFRSEIGKGTQRA